MRVGSGLAAATALVVAVAAPGCAVSVAHPKTEEPRVTHSVTRTVAPVTLTKTSTPAPVALSTETSVSAGDPPTVCIEGILHALVDGSYRRVDGRACAPGQTKKTATSEPNSATAHVTSTVSVPGNGPEAPQLPAGKAEVTTATATTTVTATETATTTATPTPVQPTEGEEDRASSRGQSSAKKPSSERSDESKRAAAWAVPLAVITAAVGIISALVRHFFPSGRLIVYFQPR